MMLIILNSTVGTALIIYDVQIKLHRPSYSSSLTACLLQLLYHNCLDFVVLQSGFNPLHSLYITTHWCEETYKAAGSVTDESVFSLPLEDFVLKTCLLM